MLEFPPSESQMTSTSINNKAVGKMAPAAFRYLVTFREDSVRKASLIVQATDEKDAIRVAKSLVTDADWETELYDSTNKTFVQKVRDTSASGEEIKNQPAEG